MLLTLNVGYLTPEGQTFRGSRLALVHRFMHHALRTGEVVWSQGFSLRKGRLAGVRDWRFLADLYGSRSATVKFAGFKNGARSPSHLKLTTYLWFGLNVVKRDCLRLCYALFCASLCDLEIGDGCEINDYVPITLSGTAISRTSLSKLSAPLADGRRDNMRN